MPKIEVTADVSSAQREVNKLGQTAANRQRSTGGDAELRRQQALERAMARQRQEVERTAKAYRELGRTVSEFQAKAANAAFRRMQGGQGAHSPYVSGLDLGDVISGSGAFTSRFSTQQDSQRVRQQIINSINQRAGLSSGGRRPSSFIEQRAGRMGGVIGAGLGAMATGFSTGGAIGSLGTLGGGAIGGAIGGMFGPVGSLFGGAIGSGLGGAIGGKMDSSLQDSITAATSASTLRATLGQVANTFDEVHDAAKRAGHGLGITSIEVQRLGTMFAKTAGSRDAADVTDSVRDSAGFARGFGLSDEFSTKFFAQLRQSKVSLNSDDSRRVGGVIAEGIVKGGGVAKTEEFMGAVSQYMSAQLHQSSVAPDVNGFATLLSTLSGKGGMDTGVAGGLLNRADAGIRQHGDLAVEAFKLGTAKRLYGNSFSGLDLKSLEQGGFFSSAGGSLGKGSTMYRLAESMGDKDYMARVSKYGNSAASFGIGLTQDAVREARGNTQIAAESVGRLTGLNQEQSAALALAVKDPEKLGALRGVAGNMNMRNMATAAQVLSGTDDDLRKMASDFARGDGIKRKMSATNAGQLAELANSGSSDQLRTALLNTLKHVEVTDLGQNVAATTADIKEVTMSITDKLIPAVEGVKDTILWAAGKDKSDFDSFIGSSKQRAYDAEVQRVARMKSSTSASGYGGELDEDIKTGEANIARLKIAADKEKAAAKAAEDSLKTFDMNTPNQSDYLDRLAGVVQHIESRGRRYDANGNLLTSPKGAKGEMQVLDGTNRDPGFGVTPAKDNSPEERARVGRDYIKAMYSRYGSADKAMAAYNAGPGTLDKAIAKGGADWLSLMPEETRKYVANGMMQMRDEKVPGGAKGSDKLAFEPAAVNVTVKHENRDGSPAGLPQTQTTILKPRLGAG